MKALQLLATLLLVFGVMSQSPYGIYADLLLSLSDKALYEAALSRRVGRCFISTCKPDQSCSCDLYAQVSLDEGKSVGLPDLYGTGCVVAPDMPKKICTCWGGSNNYPFYNKSSTPICSKCGIANAANMIRIGIMKGYCKLPICTSYPTCPALVPK
jgi:hypothetical protein